MVTQTILKSAKLLPVMAGSIVILRRRFRAREWIAALMLTSGLLIFNLSSQHPTFAQALIAMNPRDGRKLDAVLIDEP